MASKPKGKQPKSSPAESSLKEYRDFVNPDADPETTKAYQESLDLLELAQTRPLTRQENRRLLEIIRDLVEGCRGQPGIKIIGEFPAHLLEDD